MKKRKEALSRRPGGKRRRIKLRQEREAEGREEERK